MSFVRTTRRLARKPHICTGGHLIAAGERYLEHVAAPGGELGYLTWQRIAECRECAERYGRSVA